MGSFVVSCMGSSPVWSTNMKRVQLWQLNNFFGLIIPEKTGIIYSNQTGGHTCNHPEVEGYYIPLMTGWKPESDPLYNSGNETYDPKEVQKFIEASEDLKYHFRPVTQAFLDTKQLVDEQELWMEEAWIPIMTRLPHQDELGEGHARSWEELIPVDKFGILTYENSD